MQQPDILSSVFAALASIAAGVITFGSVWKFLSEPMKNRIDELENRVEQLCSASRDCELKHVRLEGVKNDVEGVKTRLSGFIERFTETRLKVRREEQND